MGIERRTIATSDGGALDAELDVGDAPWAAAVLAHPHPQYGGSMRSPLIESLFGGLRSEGVAVLRFDFRGVGRSTGSHGGGVAEVGDVEAAVDTLAAAVSAVPLVAAGWSFGADVSLCVADRRIDAWFAAAPPLRSVSADAMVAAKDPRPKLLAVPEHDQITPPGPARRAIAEWTATRLEVVPGTDHSFVGAASRTTGLCLELLRELRARP